MTIGETTVRLRTIAGPADIERARTLPAAWYADDAFFAEEMTRVFRNGWVCAGVADELPAAGSWRAISVGGVPVLIVRDRDDVLRAFFNVCRHRASPLCDDVGSGSLIRCPYHSWLYRLDGSLARAAGVGEPEGFDVADFGLRPVGIAQWRNVVFVNVADATATLELGPLADAVAACPMETMQLVLSESNERSFNWKVLLENYSENYHTPFIHPEIDTSSSEDYPMISDGPVLYAWDRKLVPSHDDDEVVRATLLPGEPGWERVFAADTDRPYDVGSYLTIWPNAMINLFPDAALVMWMQPIDARTTRVERRLYVAPGKSADAVAANIAAHRLVHDQDVRISEAVQRSHSAGIDADGVLATVEERGVFFVHQHLRRAMGARVPS